MTNYVALKCTQIDVQWVGSGNMSARRFKSGDWVVYRVSKRSSHPGPRAKHIEPAQFGESYSYQVDKYWVVDQVETSGELVLCTRRGKKHRISSQDHCLRHANLLEKVFLKNRFPKRTESTADD